jgi:hypothetical protein
VTDRIHIYEPTDSRLGRHVEHDDRSKAYMAATAAPKTTMWTHHGRKLDQGNLGSCTGNALANWLMTNPAWHKGRTLHEKEAIALYKRATALDGVPGEYPPEDTGSTGLAVCKAGVEAGYLGGYGHAFGLSHALGALSVSPVIAGVPWYESMFEPNSHGYVEISPNSSVAGGHEICLIGVSVEHRIIKAINSWGKDWGDEGYFTFSWDTFDRLLSEDGDVTVPRLPVSENE